MTNNSDILREAPGVQSLPPIPYPSQGWAKVRRKLQEALLDPERLDEVDRITKVWERVLKCERLARDLEAEDQSAVTIDIKIEGV